MEPAKKSDLRCPICGEGVLGDISYSENRSDPDPQKQAPESHETLSFSCGHEVEAGQLGEAARNDQDVERRQSDESVPEPIEMEGGTS
jgi:hypothetical protein